MNAFCNHFPMGVRREKDICMNKPISAMKELSAKYVAKFLGISILTIYRYARLGKIKAYKKISGQIYFYPNDVVEFKNQYKQVNTKNTPISGKDIGMKTIRGYLMTVRDVAAFLKVSVRWVEMHMAEGTFPVRWFPVGLRGRVFDSADIDEWLSKIWIEAGEATLPLKAVRKASKPVREKTRIPKKLSRKTMGGRRSREKVK